MQHCQQATNNAHIVVASYARRRAPNAFVCPDSRYSGNGGQEMMVAHLPLGHGIRRRSNYAPINHKTSSCCSPLDCWEFPCQWKFRRFRRDLDFLNIYQDIGIHWLSVQLIKPCADNESHRFTEKGREKEKEAF